MKRNPLNSYVLEMAEYNLGRNPTSSEVILVLNSITRDHYQDAVMVENNRIKKRAIVKKDNTLKYVQFNVTDQLMEDTDSLPWIVSMTLKDIVEKEGSSLIPRIPRTDDQILIDGRLYTVSFVEPANRYLDSVVNLTVYPEHSEEEVFDIYSLTKVHDKDDLYSVVWYGNPSEYRLNFETKGDVSSNLFSLKKRFSPWKEFKSYIKSEGAVSVSFRSSDNLDKVVTVKFNNYDI